MFRVILSDVFGDSIVLSEIENDVQACLFSLDCHRLFTEPHVLKVFKVIDGECPGSPILTLSSLK